MTELEQCDGCASMCHEDDLTENETAGLLFCQACQEENEEGEDN